MRVENLVGTKKQLAPLSGWLAVLAFSVLVVLALALYAAQSYLVQTAGLDDPTPWPRSLEVVLSEETIHACANHDEPNERAPVESYWYPGTFGNHDGLFRDWYSRQLCAMGELPLARPERFDAKFRFIWLRSFHPGIAIRVEQTGSEAKLVATVLSGVGGYRAGSVAQRVEKKLSMAAWQGLWESPELQRVWTLPIEGQRLGADGARWILEVANHDRYYVVHRWSGEELEALGLGLLSLAGIDPDPIY